MTPDIIIPNSLYVPNTQMRLLSPQHYAQESNDNQPKKDGTWCATYHDRIVLYWKQRRYKRTIKTQKLSQGGNNVSNLYTAPGYKAYTTFTENLDLRDDEPLWALSSTTTHDPNAPEGEQWSEDGKENDKLDFNLQGQQSTKSVVWEDINQDQEGLVSPTAELLRIHHRLGHLPFAQIRGMSQHDMLPKRLLSIEPPICTSCMYSKATRRPWRGKPTTNAKHTIKKAMQPGQCNRPTGVEHPRASSPNERRTNNQKVHDGHNICGASDPLRVRSLTENQRRSRNRGGQGSLRGLRQINRRGSQTLPRRQRDLR